jgi:hypothetical protein
MDARIGADWRTAMAEIETGVERMLTALDHLSVDDAPLRDLPAFATTPVGFEGSRVVQAAAAADAALASAIEDWSRWHAMLNAWSAEANDDVPVRSHSSGGR